MEYLIDEILPARQIHLLAGASGSGKTRLAIQHLALFAKGGDIWGHKSHPCAFAYLACDRPKAEYEARLEQMGLRDFPMYSLLDNKRFRPRMLKKPEQREGAMRSLIDELRKNVPDMRLLAIDPISAWLPTKLGDYHEVADALYSLIQLCQELNLTLIGTHHATKLKPATQFVRPQDRILGSAALLGYSGTHLFLTAAEETDERLTILTIVPHLAQPETHRFTTDKSTGMFEEMTPVEDVVASRKLLDLIPYPPESVSWALLRDKAVEVLKCSGSTFERHLAGLVRDGLAKKFERGRYTRIRFA